jgi:hypothetical protein
VRTTGDGLGRELELGPHTWAEVPIP